jgi:hypothetical protein
MLRHLIIVATTLKNMHLHLNENIPKSAYDAMQHPHKDIDNKINSMLLEHLVGATTTSESSKIKHRRDIRNHAQQHYRITPATWIRVLRCILESPFIYTKHQIYLVRGRNH